ncbi:MAG: TonB-dependent receptor plug domain-containing protein [Sediminibacterium sp.]
MSKKLITLSVGLIATTILYGQIDSLLKSASTLDNVIVTANKIEQKQNTTGKVVTVITSAQLNAHAGQTVAQVLSEQTGLYLPGTMSNAGTVPSIYMRGASSGRTLILVDGAPVGDPSMISNEFDLNLVPLAQIDRIEILKGSQSTMYGSDAIGGVINIITKKKSESFLTGGASFGTYGTKTNQLSLNGSLAKINYTIGFENQKADGFSSAIDKSNSGNFDNDAYKNNSWYTKLNYTINNQWSFQANTRKTAYKSSIDYGAFKDDKDEYFNNATTLSGMQLKYKKNKSTFQFQYQFTTQDRSYLNDSADKKYIIYENNQYAGKTHFADAFYANTLGKNIKWIIGSDFRYGSYYQTYASISEWGPYNENFKDTFQFQNALYGSILINNTSNKWLLELGTRYNHHSGYGDNQTFTMSPSYELQPGLRIISSISSGFKAPSLYQISYNNNLKAETSVNTEIGIEYKSSPLDARVVYFNRTINNGIDYNYIDYNFFNFIKQKVNGLELELNHRLSQKQWFSINYTLLNGQETNQNRITTTDTITYPYLLKRPKHSIQLQYHITVNSKWQASIAGRYISSRYDVGGYATPDVALDPYTILNAHIQYQAGKRIHVYADLQNLLQVHFQEIYGYNTMGRSIQIGFRLR